MGRLCEQQNVKRRAVKKRQSEHIGYITNNITSQPTVEHFNLTGHSTSDLSVTILELLKRRDESYKKEIGKYFTRKLNAYHIGINRQKLEMGIFCIYRGLVLQVNRLGNLKIIVLRNEFA